MNTRWRRHFGWSKSRAEVFRDCRKRYAFQYLYKWEPGPTAAMAKRLGKLTSLPAQIGSLVHDEIHRVVEARLRGRDDPPETSTHRLGTLLSGIAEAPGETLMEARFEDLAGDELATRLESARARVSELAERFHRDHWPRYREQEILTAEKLESFTVGEHRVWVVPDLVVRDAGGGVRLVDWKTGEREDEADGSPQLGVYLMWIVERFGVPLDRTSAELVWLASGRVAPTTRSPDQLAELAETIAADSREMLAISEWSQITASPEPHRCRRCPFRPLCREAQPGLAPEVRARVLGWLGDEAESSR